MVGSMGLHSDVEIKLSGAKPTNNIFHNFGRDVQNLLSQEVLVLAASKGSAFEYLLHAQILDILRNSNTRSDLHLLESWTGRIYCSSEIQVRAKVALELAQGFGSGASVERNQSSHRT